jgi:hypothetical protein
MFEALVTNLVVLEYFQRLLLLLLVTLVVRLLRVQLHP